MTLNVIATGVYEKFSIDYQVQKSLITMVFVVVALIILLYISVMRTILNLDYQVNAIELAIKKTLGYSVLMKNRRYFVTAIVICAVNIIAAIVYTHQNEAELTAVTVAVPVVLLVLNIGLIYLLIHKIEAQKLTKILKGGAL